MLERFSAGAIQALNAAREEALRLEFSQVDTDHLLLGLLHERQGLAARVMRAHDVEQRQVRVAVEQESGRGYSMTRSDDLVFAVGSLRVLARAAVDRPTLVESQDLFAALVREGAGAAHAVLRRLGLDAGDLNVEVARHLVLMSGEGPEPGVGASILPERFGPRLLTPAGASVMDYATSASRFFGHTIVGTEQVLTGLLHVHSGLASTVLRANDVDALAVEAVASRVIGRGSGVVAGHLVWSRWCEEVLELAWSAARRKGHTQVGTGHILLGLTDLDVGGALFILDHLEANLGQIRADVEAAFAAAPGDPEPVGVGAAHAELPGDEAWGAVPAATADLPGDDPWLEDGDP